MTAVTTTQPAQGTTSSLDTDALLRMIHRNGKIVKELPTPDDSFSGMRISEEDTGLAVVISIGIAVLLVCCFVLWRRGHFKTVPSIIVGLCPICCRSVGADVVASITLFLGSFFSTCADSNSKHSSPYDGADVERGDCDKVASEKTLQAIWPTLLMSGNGEDPHSPKGMSTSGNLETKPSPQVTLEQMPGDDHPQTQKMNDSGAVENTIVVQQLLQEEVVLATRAVEDTLWQPQPAEVIEINLPPHIHQDVQPVGAEGPVSFPPSLATLKPVGAEGPVCFPQSILRGGTIHKASPLSSLILPRGEFTRKPPAAVITPQKRPDDVVEAPDEGFFIL